MAVEVDGYDVLERIGRGGAGTVYLARQRSLDRLVALKILDVGGGVTPDRFLREAQVLAQIHHPHLVDVIDHGMADGQPWYAMRYCGGGSVSEILARDGVLTPGTAVTIGASVAEALAALHDRGIVHRDVKPANVFLTDEGDVLLGDLGVAFSLESDRVTTSGQVLGTMGYTAPELLSGLAPSPATDVFALGVMLYELVSGQKPFRGAHPAAVIDAIGKGRWQPLAEVAPQAPTALVELVEQTLAGEPAARPGDLRLWADELRWALREAGDRPGRVEPITTRIDPSLAGSNAGDTSPAPPPRTRDLTPGSSPRHVPAGAPPIAAATPPAGSTAAASSTTISTTPPLARSSDSMPVAGRPATTTARKRSMLLAVGAVALVALIAGVALVMASRGGDDEAAVGDGGRVLPAELSAKASVTSGLAPKAPAEAVALDASWEIVGTEGVRGFTTLRNTGDEPVVVAHDEIIPKELVADVADLATDPPWIEVIDPDPIVRFCLRLEPGDAVEITWWSLEPAMGLDQTTLDELAAEWSATYDAYDPADPVEACEDLYADEELAEIAAAADGETTTSSTDAETATTEDGAETTEAESSVPETTAFPDADGDGVADIFDAVDDRAAPTTTRVITTTATTRPPTATPAPTTAAPAPATTTTTRPPATTTTRPPTTTAAPTTAPPPPPPTTTPPNTVTLPNFVGGSRDAARNWIISNGLIWDQKVTGNAPAGTAQFQVVGQSPPGGSTVQRNTIVTITSYDPAYCPPSGAPPDCV
jgi:serine/threonine-protein kinase